MNVVIRRIFRLAKVIIYVFTFSYNQASGVKVLEDVKVKFDEIKKKKSHRYMVFFIKDEKAIAVEKIGKVSSQRFLFLRVVLTRLFTLDGTECLVIIT